MTMYQIEAVPQPMRGKLHRLAYMLYDWLLHHGV